MVDPSYLLNIYNDYDCIFAAASSSEIRDSLNDKALQDLICRIDSSSNAEDVRNSFFPISLYFLKIFTCVECVSFNTHRGEVIEKFYLNFVFLC